jgi:hypothetical protein
MRLDLVACVVDPTNKSDTINDIMFTCTPKELQNWCKGGDMVPSLTFYTSDDEALVDAEARLAKFKEANR